MAKIQEHNQDLFERCINCDTVIDIDEELCRPCEALAEWELMVGRYEDDGDDYYADEYGQY